MKSLLVLATIFGICAGIHLTAGQDENKDKEKNKDSANPKATTVSADAELKGQVVMEEKELKKHYLLVRMGCQH